MIDKNSLPEVLADLLAAQKTFDSNTFVKCFAKDAMVHDEGGDYRGTAAIKLWNETTNEKYKTMMEPIGFEEKNGESILTIMMSGTFPGSPLPAKFHFTIMAGKIASLRVE